MEIHLFDLDMNSIIDSYGPLVSSICRRMIGNEENARDAAQEAWIEILKGIQGYRGDAKMSTWIYTSILNPKRCCLKKIIGKNS